MTNTLFTIKRGDKVPLCIFTIRIFGATLNGCWKLGVLMEMEMEMEMEGSLPVLPQWMALFPAWIPSL